MKYDTIFLKCLGNITSLFMPELQKGFYIHSYHGKSIYSVLTEECGISYDYISEKVKTVLVDGGPVDDIFNTTIKNNGVCAISGAMPGIVGAMMRIGSPYAAMRKSITVQPDKSVESDKNIIFKLKFFNVILSDKGLEFLKRGILIERKRFVELLSKHGEEIYSNSIEILLNDSKIEKGKLILELSIDKKENISDLFILKIVVEDESKS